VPGVLASRPGRAEKTVVFGSRSGTTAPLTPLDWVMVGFPLVRRVPKRRLRTRSNPRSDYESKTPGSLECAIRKQRDHRSDIFIPTTASLSVGADHGEFPTEFKEENPLSIGHSIPPSRWCLPAPSSHGPSALKQVQNGGSPTIANTITPSSRLGRFQLQIADAAALIDTAHLHVYRPHKRTSRGSTSGRQPRLSGYARG